MPHRQAQPTLALAGTATGAGREHGGSCPGTPVMTTRPWDMLCDTGPCGAAWRRGWHRPAPPTAAAAGPPQALAVGKGLLPGQSAHLCPAQSQPRGAQAHGWGHCWGRLGPLLGLAGAGTALLRPRAPSPLSAVKRCRMLLRKLLLPRL